MMTALYNDINKEIVIVHSVLHAVDTQFYVVVRMLDFIQQTGAMTAIWYDMVSPFAVF